MSATKDDVRFERWVAQIETITRQVHTVTAFYGGASER
jgi:hypothetical protein